MGFFLGSLHPSNSKMATSSLRTPRLGSASPAETQNRLPKSLSKNLETDSSLRDVSLSLSLNALLMGRWMDGTWPGPDHLTVLSQRERGVGLIRASCTVSRRRPAPREKSGQCRATKTKHLNLLHPGARGFHKSCPGGKPGLLISVFFIRQTHGRDPGRETTRGRERWSLYR